MRNVFLCLAILFCSCSGLKYEKHPKTEFRGTWVATVVNIDWPKSANHTVEKQKEDFIELLDFYDDLNFNTLIVQVRTAGDAFYPSELAPWSRFLSGEEGSLKPDFEDPLQWMLDKTHERGMQFHAWLNPYRATFDLDTTILAENHDFKQHREWMIKYGKKYYYDPGNKEVQQHLTNIVSEVVQNYAVDGIHFDDYFYPYKITSEVFNDSLSYKNNKTNHQSLEDWRRSNVDSLIKKVHQTIQKSKPWVRFGVSPFGVWKNQSTDPKGSATKAGQTTYEDLYADPIVWMKNGWLDYIVPQAYWSMQYPPAAHETITNWWAKNSSNANLYMGNGAYKIRNNADEAWNHKKEIPKQLALARNTTEVSGNVFFSAKSLISTDKDIKKQLRKKFYQQKALQPSMINKPNRNVTAPIITSVIHQGDQMKVTVSHFDTIPRFLNIYKSKGRPSTDSGELLKKTYISKNKGTHVFLLKKQRLKLLRFQIEDAYGNRSEMTVVPKNLYNQ